MVSSQKDLSNKEYLKLLKGDRERVLFKNIYPDPKTGKFKRLPYGARCLGLALLDKSPGTKIVWAKLARKFGITAALVSRWKKALVDAGLWQKEARPEKTSA